MSLTEQLRQFRAGSPSAIRRIGGHDWTFIATGTGTRTVVLLPGGGGDAECQFPMVTGLSPFCRVLAIGYPPTVTTAAGLIAGICALLDDIGVRNAVLLGHSLGGMLACALAREHPERVEALVVANAAPYSRSRRLMFRLVLPLLASLPQALLVRSVRAGFRRLLRGRPEAAFWQDYLGQAPALQPGSPALRNQLRCLLDLVRCESAPGSVPARWTGAMLIIESERETGFTAEERRDFRAQHPAAVVRVIPGAGHLSYLTHPEPFLAAVQAWLRGMA